MKHPRSNPPPRKRKQQRRIGDRVGDLERNVVAQEHRPVAVLANFFRFGLPRSKHDRRWASRTALAMLLFAPSTLIIGGSIVAIVNLLQVQEQIDIDRQSDYETRKAILLSKIYATERRWPWSEPEPVHSDRVRWEAARSYIALQNGRGEPVDLTGAVIRGLKLEGRTGLNLNGAVLNGAVLDAATLRGVEMQGASLINASLRGANLYDVDLTEANLFGSVLEDAVLVSVSLRLASPASSSFRSCVVHGVDCRSADFSHAVFQDLLFGDCRFGSADLFGAEISKCWWADSTYTDDTKWPDGFSPKARGLTRID
ncbi:MAG: pentapeptide repeat-containing protein [bacterium]|nr:pentapeptide repeat-containing protein [bacterium]